MSDPTRNLESILAALAAQKAPTSTPPQGQPGLPPPPAGGSGYQMPQAPYQAQPPAPGYGAPPAYSYPQPTSSGNLDLSAVQPTQSGSVSIDEAIARAKAHAARNGVTPYERPAGYSNAPRGGDGERYRGSRSRSPPARRDAFRDNHNPYRDERREDRGGYGGRDRSFSPRGHDRNSGAFSPRGGHAGGRDGGDDNSEIIEVEASLVGLIIGRQGENLRRVEGDSQCRVQFLAASSPSAEQRQCKITGPRARRAEAKAAINRIIEDSGMGAIARAGLDRGGRDSGRGGGGGAPAASSQPPPLKEGEDCLQIMVPDRTVGLIIGRGGETIRDLQERSGCHVNIVGESKSVNGLRPVNLIGPRQAAIVAKDLIMEIVDSDSRNTNSGGNAGQSRPPRNHHDGGAGGHDKINDSIYVPSEAVGMIIGKGGETIREIQSTTGCKINVSQSSGPGETEREIGLVGSREAISMAKQAIEDKVDAVRQKGGHPGGGRGGGGRPHRDYDNPNYGQPSHQAPSQAPAAQPPAGGSGDADPYAAYGGYQAYLALWYAYAQQQQAQGGDAGKPPGTA